MTQENTKPDAAQEEQSADTQAFDGFDSSEARNQLSALTKEEIIEGAIKQQQLIIECEAKNQELTTLLKRVQADFDNYRKRNNESLKRIRQDATVDVIEGFLPTLDIIDQAISMIKDEQVLGGIKMMRRSLLDVFASYDVFEIDSLDADFDPKFHEAVMSEENPQKAGKVIEVLRKGYRMGERILRYAAVKVAN